MVSILIDASALYKEAATIPDNEPAISQHLELLAAERDQQREYLQARVVALGGKADTMGEALGTGHRAFTLLRTAVDNDTEVAIEEVLRGERYIVEEIGKIQTTGLTPDSVELLNSLRENVQDDIVTLEALDRAV